MGCDKSALLVKGGPLWRHQLATLRATNPAELFISGRSDGPYADCGVEILADEFPDCGPLGGIATALRRCKSDQMLVLAVDMPAMSAVFLRALLEQSRRQAAGIVPEVAAGEWNGTGRRRRPKAARGDLPGGEDDRARISPPTDDGGQRMLQPLAAVYPRAALRIAGECLRAGERKLENFIRALEARGLATILAVKAGEAALFTNWNNPDDIPLPPAG
jgi:molybdopterin-guanine dinucleotide biosynthesis protein A